MVVRAMKRYDVGKWIEGWVIVINKVGKFKKTKD